MTGREEQDRVSREMVLAFGLDHIIVSADRPQDPAASRYLENTATTRGKPSITAEAGHAGTVEPEDVDALVRRLPERDALPQDAARRAGDGPEPGLDRQRAHRHQRRARASSTRG